MHHDNNWNIAYVFLNTILICSLPSMSVYGNIPNVIKAVNTHEDDYSKNFNVTWMKKNYCHYCTQDLNQTAEKNAPNEIIRVPPLEVAVIGNQ